MNARFILLLSVAASACATPAMPQSVATNGELRLLPPAAFASDAWHLNNYKKQQRVALEYPQERTPSGSPCLRIDFQSPEGGCNVISPELEPDGAWRHGAYEAVVLWVKGDAGGQRLSLTASSQANRCVWQIPLDAPDWKQIILPVSAASSQDRQPLDLGTIKRLAFSCPAAVSVRVGDIRLRPAALHLPVERPRSFVIPVKAGESPVIDGRLDDPAWKDALAITNFVLTRSGAPATEATGFRLLSDGKNLYIGARMADADTAELRAGQTVRDAPVWKDDCLEIFVDGTLDAMSYRHLVINPAGTVEDYHYQFSQEKETFVADHAWNPAFSHGEQVLAREWTVEMAIPLDALGLVEGTPFGFQLARENHGIKEYSALVPTERFNTPATFAVGMIGRATQEVSEIGLSMQAPGNMQVSGRVTGPGSLALEAVVADPAGGTLQIPLTAHSDTTGAFVAPFVIATPLEGPYRVTVSGAFNGDPLVPCAMRFVMSLPSEIAFGDIYLNPQPKECSFQDGVFVFDGATPIVVSDQASARSRQTARFLRTELHHDLFGMLPPITAMPGEGAAFRLALREDAGLPAAVKDTAAALPAEGYLLAVAPEGVTLVGADEPGLYYGVVTLIHLARAHVLKHHAPELGAVEIRDWPDLPLRFVTLWASSFKRPKEPRNDLDTLKQYLKEVIAGNKFNAFSLMLDYEFEYDAESRITEIGGMFSREDYRELARFAREHFIEFIPALQSGGHSRHFVRAHPPLQEPGFDNTQVNVLHADWHKVLFACYRDILSAVPDAKHFFIWHDEWWHHPTGTVSETVDGKPRWEIFRDEILANHRFFAERDIRMIMCADMLAKDHNGGAPLHLSRGLEIGRAHV